MEYPTKIGDWMQICILGSGAFGDVMLWTNKTTEESVAIKKCKFQTASALSDKQKERWHKEVDFMKSINHLNIIKFKSLPHDLETILLKYNPTRLPLLSMEYCTKGNLRRYMLNEPIRLCGLPESDVRAVLRDISSGLSYLHSNKITHRDIKPENIVLQHCDNRKTNIVYKIIDLGYAKELQDTVVSFVGTLHYLAPEIFRNKPYDHTVDYWSMGLLVFEIICGLLPFLPELNPFERYEKIRDKGPDDICIYMQYSGALANSSEIKKENFITSCLKQNIETWLKRVLQFDPSKRCFSSLDIFEYLHFILDKRIIKVFSVYKLEFYSYEINDGTLLGTLKDWISRDIKIPKKDLLVLFKNEPMFCHDDDAILHELVTEDTVFVFKKGALISDSISFTVPKLVQQVLQISVSFQLRHVRNLFRQALFFIYSEKLAVEMLHTGFELYVKYLGVIVERVGQEQKIAHLKLAALLRHIESITNNKICDVELNDNKEAIECLVHLKRVLSSLERSKNKYIEFLKESSILTRLWAEVLDLQEDLEDCFRVCLISEQYSKISSKNFLEMKNNETSKEMLNRIAKVISDTIKLKTKFIHKNEKLKNCGRDFGILSAFGEELINWIQDYVIHIDHLSSVFEQTYLRYRQLVEKENTKIENCCDLEEGNCLIEENKDIRFKRKPPPLH
ncbi:inhibitor of nuclear factor kappa-B kinase subunit beta-like isoform X2 [Cylas formicarius]|uniref:inhibitor of nuclear factor kappa-B kinase subunit beta-like isoform X2 n=1 Tax=Cylas formicarius TaxID=197179 RepID=UPI0029584B30|nr:inhibitor of nuclear factor kappa-B kinase subunit beta-like isoform X2 [Cylas formicarius]